MSERVRPSASYAVWHTQRTGSSLLCEALRSTGIAGDPPELLVMLREEAAPARPDALRDWLWHRGTSANGVFGAKIGCSLPQFSDFIASLAPLVPAEEGAASAPLVFAHVFPHCRHVVMTRRNKVRLAVSWWCAIRTGVWHLPAGQRRDEARAPADDRDAYDFRAIRHLMTESVLREAGIQEFLAALGAVPLMVCYEDLVAEFDVTVRRVLAHVGLEAPPVLAPPGLAKTAGEIEEHWAERFRHELQADWTNRGW